MTTRSATALAAFLATGLLAGDVGAAGGAVHVSDGSRGVRITGDSNDNDVSVSQSGNTITIQGNNGTTVTVGPGATRDPAAPNDTTRAVVTGAGNTTRVRIDVQGGDNNVGGRNDRSPRVQSERALGSDRCPAARTSTPKCRNRRCPPDGRQTTRSGGGRRTPARRR